MQGIYFRFRAIFHEICSKRDSVYKMVNVKMTHIDTQRRLFRRCAQTVVNNSFEDSAEFEIKKNNNIFKSICGFVWSN